MKLLNTIATTAVISASFICATPVEAFWGDKGAQQRKDILGRWQCEVTRNGKKADWPVMMKFKSNGQVYVDTDIKGQHQDVKLHWRMKVNGAWSIPKSGLLTFGAGHTTITNLSTIRGKYGSELKSWRKSLDEEMGYNTGTKYTDIHSNNEIITVAPKILIFQEEGGGDETICRK